MNKTIFLKICRGTLLANALLMWLTILVLLISGESSFILRRPLGMVVYMLAVSRYTTYTGWRKYALLILPPLVWSLSWASLVGSPEFSISQLCLYGLVLTGLSALAHWALRQ